MKQIIEDSTLMDSITRSIIGNDNDDTYCFIGKYSRFFGREADPFGYKIFGVRRRKLRPIDESVVNRIFKIQNLLFEGGYAPKAHEIIKHFDGSHDRFIIKMERIKGEYVTPDRRSRWIRDFKRFCGRNALWRERVSPAREARKIGNSILSNEDKKIYMVDIDEKWRQGDSI